MLARMDHSSRQIIADKGERIYQDLFREEYEANFPGQFVVIEVVTKRAYASETAEVAISKATEHTPDGLFHMVRIQGSAPNRSTFSFRKMLAFVRRLSDIRLP